MTSVTVIIPTLNEEVTIGPLLSRLRHQDFSGSLEVIVVDGGSTDTTRDIVTPFAEFGLITRSRGVSVQRNAGAIVATGDLLIFLDADTQPSNSFVRKIVNDYDRAPFAAACPWFVPATRRPDIHAIYWFLNCLFFASQVRFHTGAGVCIATPRRVFETIGGFDKSLHLGEDVNYLQRAAKVGVHRHLLLPLLTSARRFETQGVFQTALLYARISPALLAGDRKRLQGFEYPPVRK
jgi:glycosyltransferase involved in cell wall biosynthesis